MIDEELYQQAADELNSDRRKPHIWARACALASDDHDEARYLYTNLRVEELIAEREAGGRSRKAKSNYAEIDADPDDLALEPVLFPDPDSEDSISVKQPSDNFLEIHADDTPSASPSARSGFDAPADSDNLLDLIPLETEEAAENDLDLNEPPIDATYFDSDSIAAELQQDNQEEESDALTPDRNHDETLLAFGDTAELGLDSAEIAGINDTAPSELPDIDDLLEETITDQVREADEDINDLLGNMFPGAGDKSGDKLRTSDKIATQEVSATLEERLQEAQEQLPSAAATVSKAAGETILPENDELEWLDEDIKPERAPGKLARYAPVDEDHEDEVEDDALAQELERQADELPGQRSDVLAHEAVISDAIRSDYADTNDFRDEFDENRHKVPLDLTEGRRGVRYAIYRRDGSRQAVKNGVSWSALFFTLPWLLYRQLFGTAIMYSLLWVISIGGLVLCGLAWLDAGNSASTMLKLATAGFGLLAIIGLLYLPFRFANSWRAEKLENRGFELMALVRAKNPGKALLAARRAASLD